MQPLHPPSRSPVIQRAGLVTLLRAFALFLGGFTLLNLAGGFWRTNFDSNLWWLDTRALPAFVAKLVFLFGSLGLIRFALRPPRSVRGRRLTAGVLGLIAVIALWNSVEFYHALLKGGVRPFLPMPLSLFLAVGLILIVREVIQPRPASARGKISPTLLILVAFWVIGFPLATLICFGKTDYRRPADVAVVFGARTYADGRPSDALADRVRTASRLYHDGLVGKLIFSGGPGDGAIHETEAMRRLAVQLGVRPEDILVDREGLNTQATVRNTEAMFAQLQARRVLVVSHYYHLPRIKLAYQRAGREVYTVPVNEGWWPPHVYSVAREVPAFWIYYLNLRRLPA